MSGDKRKDLRLVKPAPPSEAEVDRAAEALRAALAPEPLGRADHEALLAMVLGDEAAEIATEEQTAAEALRCALEGEGTHPLADLAADLRAAAGAGAIGEADHEALLAATLGIEIAEADEEPARLAAALEGRGHHPLATFAAALRHATQPAPLASADGEALLGLALGAEIAPSEDDLREAAALREALAGRGDHPLAGWAEALRAAAGQLGPLDELRHERLLRRVLSQAAARPGALIATLVAVAAAIALFVGSWRETVEPQAPVAARAPAVELVSARSTQPLFDPTVPFAARGGESERMDRIVEARAADLRANRFAAWGVR